MRCRILHENKTTIRAHVLHGSMSLQQADILEYYLKAQSGVTEVKVYERTGDVWVRFSTERQKIRQALSVFHYEEAVAYLPERTGRALAREYEDKIVFHLLKRCLTRIFLPMYMRDVLAVIKSVHFVMPGIKALLHEKLEVSVLDATTIVISMLRGSFDTAGDLMFLLGLGEILEEWTHKKSVDDLARSMALNIEKAWVIENNQSLLKPVSDIQLHDHVMVSTGNVIPLDGFVVQGSAEVNQSSFTGESLPVEKKVGSPVFAGTVVEQGECVIDVSSTNGKGRYDRLVSMIENSEKLKSDFENRASLLANRLVPYSFLGTAVTYLLTKNVDKALSVLMVDFSCALKLSIPIAVLSAMRQASSMGMMVKGGKYLENLSQADIFVFDKTGTLTVSQPRVAGIVAFGNYNAEEMLRLAACLEEHYPHSIANAVVKEAAEEGLIHEEKHSKVEYIVAHGIASSIDNQHVLLGSYHFLFEDGHCKIPQGEEERFEKLSDDYSHLYMAIEKELVAVILIEDPLRKESKQLIDALRKRGVQQLVMMTGDSSRTAKNVAEKLGLDEYQSEVLPEDKAKYVEKQKESGHKVVMIGDGVNDALALSKADVAIAISNGAAIAREIADITIPEKDIEKLVVLRRLSEKLEQKIQGNYRKIMIINSGLIALGVLGILPPSITAYLHNLSTLLLSVDSMQDIH